jgi:micrococcal nuclease
MFPRRRRSAPLIAVLAALLVAAWFAANYQHQRVELLPLDEALLVPQSVLTQQARVARAIDGDTVELADGRTVRYVGIDAPERGQPFYDYATQLNKMLVLGKTVGLFHDKEPQDHYGRELCYVIDLRTRVLINGEMIRHGAAHVYTVPPNVLYHEELTALQRAARNERRGLWSQFREGNESGYVASRRGYVFHRPSCADVHSISPGNRVEFASRGEAFDRGLSPCRDCDP